MYGQLDINTLFNYELAPVVTSLFEDSSKPRYPTSKSDLVKPLKVEVSLRGIKYDAIVVDCGGMLHRYAAFSNLLAKRWQGK